MDFLKHLIQLNNEEFLRKKSQVIYPIDNDDDPTFVYDLRTQFIQKYNKSNNRQFRKTKF